MLKDFSDTSSRQATLVDAYSRLVEKLKEQHIIEKEIPVQLVVLAQELKDKDAGIYPAHLTNLLNVLTEEWAPLLVLLKSTFSCDTRLQHNVTTLISKT